MNEIHHANTHTVLWSEVKEQFSAFDGELVDIEIPSGLTVILDEDAGPLGTLAIHGKLKASESADVTLTANNVLVFGALEVGSEDTPHTRKFEILLTGEAGDPDVVLADWVDSHGMDHGGYMDGAHAHHMTDPIDNKALIVAPGGTIDLHGADATSWTQLDGTVEAGATSIKVLDATGWKVGDVITIAPTGMDAFEVEDRVITSIDGTTIGFDEPLEHRHYGAQQDLGDGQVLDMRAEVANLSRNITIRGEEDPNETTGDTNSEHEGAAQGRVAYGGHVMIIGDAQTRIDGAEFTELGITGEIGRYPLHFHHGMDQEGSYVKDASIHHTYQRGLVVHQTDNLLVEDNVVYDVMSHGIYIEDGVETGNRFEGNLVMLTLPSAQDFRLDEIKIHNRIRETGEKASGFWITNEENEFEGNHVVGVTSGQAYWFIAPDIDTSHVDRGDPRKQDNALTLFKDNTAHTIMADGKIGGNLGYGPIWTGVALDVTERLGEGSAPIEGFTAWMVENTGVSMTGREMAFADLTIADARLAVRAGNTEAYIDGLTHVVTSDNFPEAVDPVEFFQFNSFEGPVLGSFNEPSIVKGLQVVDGASLVSAISETRNIENLTLLPDDDGAGLTSIADLPQVYSWKAKHDDGSGETVFAYGGDDYLRGTSGDDVSVGGDGDDRLSGQGGDDILVGGSGADLLASRFRGANDPLGTDVMMGGAGADRLEIAAGASTTIVFQAGDGADIVDGFSSGEIALVGYAAAELDTDGDGDFDAADFDARTTSAETGRRETTTTLDLGGGDEIAFVHANDESGPRFDQITLLSSADAATGAVATALELDALPGAVSQASEDTDPAPVDPDPVDPVDPDPVDPVDPDPVDPDPVDPEPVDPDPVDPDPVDPDPVDPDPADPDPTDPDPLPVGALALIDAPIALARGEAIVIDHQDAFATDEGSFSFSFRPDSLAGTQTLFSKDSRGFDEGGHLGVFVHNGKIIVRAQTDDASHTLRGGDVSTEALNDLKLSWSNDALTVSLNGAEIGLIEGWTGGLSSNSEPIALGANQARSGDGVADQLYQYFEGEIASASFSGSAASDPSDPEPVDPGQVDPDPADPDPVDPGADAPLEPALALGDVAVSGREDVVSIDHDDGLALSEGTFAFSFISALEGHREGLFSKDARGNGDGGHLSVYVARDGDLVARFQAERGQVELIAEGAVTAQEKHDLAFSFGAEGAALFLDGALVASDADFTQGLEANAEHLQIGALGWRSKAGEDGFDSELHGTVEDFRVYDEQMAQSQIADLFG